MKIPNFLMSSVNPEQLGLTVKGFLLAIIPVVLALSGIAHWNLGQEELNSLVENITTVVIQLSGIASTIMIVWGATRKILVKTGWIQPKGQI